jgi:ABC-type transport system substrate-binding protein
MKITLVLALKLIGVLSILMPAISAHAETLVIAAQRTPEGFDGDALRPGTQEVVVQSYEGLLRYARTKADDGTEVLDSLKYEGNFAESWTISEDQLSVTFKLRQGVLSPTGNELTAEDVVWGYKKSVAQKRTGNFLITTVAKVRDVVATSKYEVTYQLTSPSAFLFPILTLYAPGIYDSTEMKKHVTGDDPWALKYLDGATAGFGAYFLESLTPNEQAVFVANPNYFRGKPYFDRVIYRAVPSASNRALLIRTGQVQWTENLSGPIIQDLRNDPKLSVITKPHRGATALVMNPAYKPFDDVRVRQAVALSIDRDAINQAVFLGQGTVAHAPVPPYIAGAANDLDPFPKRDIEKAKALLAEAGYPNGIDVELIQADIVGWEEQLGIQAVAQLAEAGIRVSLKKISPSEFRERHAIGVRDMPFHINEDGPIVLDAGYTLFVIAKTGASSNRAAYSNPDIDARIDAVGSILDDDKRLELARDIQRDWMTEAPYALIAFRPLYEVMPKTMKGFVWYPYEHERWFDLRQEQ